MKFIQEDKVKESLKEELVKRMEKIKSDESVDGIINKK